MKDSSKTKKMLVEELAELRARLAAFESDRPESAGKIGGALRLFEQGSHGFLATDDRGAALGSNTALRLMLGCRADQPLPEWTGEDIVEDVLPALEKAEKHGSTRATVAFRTAASGLQPMDCRISAVYEGGKLKTAVWTVMPLASVGSLTAVGDELLASCDMDGTLTFVSPKLRDAFGLDEDHLLGRSIIEFILPDDRPEAICVLGRFARAAMLRAPGDTQKLPQAQLALTLMVSGGRYARARAEFSLVGERVSVVMRRFHETPEPSACSEVFDALDNMASGLVVLHGSRVIFASAMVRTLFGEAPTDLPVTAFAGIAAASDREKALGLADDFQRTGRRVDFDLMVKRPEGPAVQLSFRHFPLGRVIGEDRLALIISQCSEEGANERMRMLETLVDNLPGCAYRCRNDRDWTMSFVSKGCEALTGYRPEDLLENRRIAYSHIIHPEDRRMVWDMIQKAVVEDRRFEILYRIIRADGAERRVRETGSGVTDADGLRHIEGFIIDDTEREQAVAALRQGEERLRTVIEGAPDMILIKGRDRRYTLANPAASEEIGLPASEIVGRTDVEIWGEEVARQLVEEDRLVLSGQTHRGERTISGPRGMVTLSHVKAPLRDESGNITSICSFIRNVTERAKVAAGLRESEARYRALAEASPDAIVLCDEAGILLEVNEAAVRLYGFESAGDIVGRSVFDFFADAEAESFSDFDWPSAMDRWFVKTNGSRFFGEMRFAVLGDGRVLGINRDVTDRRARQFELERLKRAMDQSGEGLMVMEPDTTVSYANKAFCQIIGLEMDEILGKRGDLIREALNISLDPEVIERIMRGETVRLETSSVRRDGQAWSAGEIVNPVLDDAGKIIGFFVVLVEKGQGDVA